MIHSVLLGLRHHYSPVLSCLAEIIVAAANFTILQYSTLSKSVVNTATICNMQQSPEAGCP